MAAKEPSSSLGSRELTAVSAAAQGNLLAARLADGNNHARMRGILSMVYALRFGRPGLGACLLYSITAEGRRSQSWPGLIPGMTLFCSSHWICRLDSPKSRDAWATVMYSSSGKGPPGLR